MELSIKFTSDLFSLVVNFKFVTVSYFQFSQLCFRLRKQFKQIMFLRCSLAKTNMGNHKKNNLVFECCFLRPIAYFTAKSIYFVFKARLYVRVRLNITEAMYVLDPNRIIKVTGHKGNNQTKVTELMEVCRLHIRGVPFTLH